MILTTCAARAAPLAHDAPRCVRCKVRYCDSTCQHDHRRRGHKQMCKKIHRGGNAEQYHADKKYKEPSRRGRGVRGRHEGPDGHICTQASIGKRRRVSCACVRAVTAASVHVSCLAEQAKILVAEGEENNLDFAAQSEVGSRHRQPVSKTTRVAVCARVAAGRRTLGGRSTTGLETPRLWHLATASAPLADMMSVRPFTKRISISASYTM